MKPPSVAVVEAVASKEDVEPNELECVLAAVIEPKALDALFESTSEERHRTSGFVTFPFCGYTVTVWANGTVEVA